MTINPGQDIIERQSTEQAGKWAEEVYQTLVEHFLQGMVIIQNARLVFANPAVVEMSGYTLEELLSFSFDNVKAAVYPEDQERVWRNMQDCLNGKSVPPDQDYRLLRKDGTVRWVEALSSRI